VSVSPDSAPYFRLLANRNFINWKQCSERYTICIFLSTEDHQMCTIDLMKAMQLHSTALTRQLTYRTREFLTCCEFKGAVNLYRRRINASAMIALECAMIIA
jgi:hypothetical protein